MTQRMSNPDPHIELSFRNIPHDEKLALVHPILAGKVYCSHCRRFYVSNDTEIEFLDGKVGFQEGHSMMDAGFAYIDEAKTVTEYVEPVRNLKLDRWVGFENPSEIKLDLKCVCGHGGMYSMKPNPFFGEGKFLGGPRRGAVLKIANPIGGTDNLYKPPTLSQKEKDMKENNEIEI